MKIEAVVVCANYADFLAWVLPVNKQHFDKMVVVTTTADKRTQRLCEFWHVQCVVTDICYENGDTFNKGKMINAGMQALACDQWVVHLDADIFLPPQFRHIISHIKLDKRSLYAVDRLMCNDFVSWLKFWSNPLMINEADIYVHLRPFPVGVRIAKLDPIYGGWVPIGFFQMWHQGSLRLTYPIEHTNAGRTDMLFSMKFPRIRRQMLSEIVAIHLETAIPGKDMGANWNGRRTPPFGWEVLGDTDCLLGPQKEDAENYTE